jgi:uncharacterized protein (DUF849 family)
MKLPVIISCAITGSVHTPSMSEYLPFTPDQIARQSIDAANAGASILHLHAPTHDPEVFMRFLPKIHAKTHAVINLSTGGGQGMSVEQRIRAARQVSPELCSLNMGSMNFGLFPAAERIKHWRFDWEKEFLESTRNLIFKNTFEDIQTILDQIGEHGGTRFEFECYDIGHLYTLAHFVERKLATPPLFIQFVMGVLGGIGADTDNLLYMIRTADKLFGRDYEFSVLAAGRHQMPMAITAANCGGNVRVGLEDSITLNAGELAQSNAQQVRKIRHLIEQLSLSIATPEQVRARLALKGKNQINL